MSRFDSSERARESIAPGDVVVAKGHVLRAVDVRSEHSLGAVRETGDGAARTMLDLDWELVDTHYDRDDIDVDALLDDLAPDEADQRDLVDDRDAGDDVLEGDGPDPGDIIVDGDDQDDVDEEGET